MTKDIEPLPYWIYYITGLMVSILFCMACVASLPAVAQMVPTRAVPTATTEGRVKDKPTETPTRSVTVIPTRAATLTPLPTFTRPATARPTPTQFRFTGQGDRLERFTLEEVGLIRFSLSHGGDRNFIVWLLDANGEQLELLANEVGDYSGETAAGLRPGNYFLQIQADGQWLISLEME